MIRRFTLICLAGAAGSGLHLYSVKRDAQMQDREIARITHEAKDVRTHAALLHAEYDLLSDPDRLKDLAGQVLKLQPTDPKHYASLTDLDKRLPPVGKLPTLPEAPEPTAETAPPPAPPVPDAEKPDAAKPDLVASAPPPVVAEKRADASSDKAAQLARLMASLGPTPTPPAASAPIQPAPAVQAATPPSPAPHPVQVVKPVVASAEPRPPLPHPSSNPQPTPIQRPMLVATAPAPRPIPAAEQTPVPTTPPPFVGSALGMARMHAAPARYVPPAGDDR